MSKLKFKVGDVVYDMDDNRKGVISKINEADREITIKFETGMFAGYGIIYGMGEDTTLEEEMRDIVPENVYLEITNSPLYKAMKEDA